MSEQEGGPDHLPAKAKLETKRLGIADLDNLAGHKTVASFARFVAGPNETKALTTHELTGLAGSRVVASFARWVAVGDNTVAEQKDSKEFEDIKTIAEFDALDAKLTGEVKYKTE